MIKAINETQYMELLEYGISVHCKSFNSLEPCYTKKQIEQVLDNIENSNIGGATMAIITFKKELEKLEGE